MRRLKDLLTVLSCCVSVMAGPEPAIKPFVLVYAPDWCAVCKDMKKVTGDGNESLTIRWLHGDGADFPDYIQRSADSYGYPVLHHVSPTGKGVLNNGRRTLKELIELVKTEPPAVPGKKVERTGPLWHVRRALFQLVSD